MSAGDATVTIDCTHCGCYDSRKLCTSGTLNIHTLAVKHIFTEEGSAGLDVCIGWVVL